MNFTRKLMRNTGWLTFREGYSVVATLLVGVFTARYLGPGNYGLLSYSMSFVALFAAVCRMGLDATVMDALVREPDGEREIVGSAVALRTALAALSQPLLVVCVMIAGGDERLIAVTLIQGASLIFDARQVLDYVFQYHLESRKSAVAGIAGVTCLCVLRVLFLILRLPVEYFALTTLAQSAVSLAVAGLLYFRKGRARLAFSLARVKRLIRAGAFFMLAALVNVVYAQIDKLMLGGMLSETHVGWYAVASYVALVGQFLPGALILSSRPLLLDMKNKGAPEYEKRFQLLLFCVLSLGLALTVGILCLGPFAVRMVYGEAYAPAGAALLILSPATLFSGLAAVRNLRLLAENKSRYVLIFSVIGAAANIALNAVLIPLYGVNGAAAATVTANFITEIIAPLLFREIRPYALLVLASPFHLSEFLPEILRRLRNRGEE